MSTHEIGIRFPVRSHGITCMHRVADSSSGGGWEEGMEMFVQVLHSTKMR